MSGLSSHVLDTSTGHPVSGLTLRLEVATEQGEWRPLAGGVTDADGRVRDLLQGAPLLAQTYRLVFETAAYFRATHRPAFFPWVEVVFTISAPGTHHHVPLLLSPFGYSTYRGS